ncbi:unnamed protein product [Pocillopora meandrina]|uniref:Uncharacterized protein n=1 Tax=Pocillopora meandrina TaxID=46732 RepID=A0AAU9XBN6_9CNID|nr:unnamed protein product [Pocillopora meandrina]
MNYLSLSRDLSNNSLRHIPQNTFRNMKKLEIMIISHNLLSIADVKVILKGLTRLHKLNLGRNPLGPSLPSDIFTEFENMTYLACLKIGSAVNELFSLSNRAVFAAE